MEITKLGIKEYLEEYGINEGLKGFAELIDERVYVKVKNFKVYKKELKLPIVVAGYLKNDLDIISDVIYESINPKERQIIKKISRLSNLSIEKLEEKLSKLLLKEFSDHILNYGKELLLRDKNRFYKIMSKFALMDSLSSKKSLLLLGFKKLDMSEDEVIYLLLSYFTKMPMEFYEHEKIQSEIGEQEEFRDFMEMEAISKDIEERIFKIKDDLYLGKSMDFFEIIPYYKLLKEQQLGLNTKESLELKIFYKRLVVKLELLESIKEEHQNKLKKISNMEELILKEILI